jgi:transcriptional regulator with XRE-family HTH domain
MAGVIFVSKPVQNSMAGFGSKGQTSFIGRSGSLMIESSNSVADMRGTELRSVRRNFGLSQAHLARLLSISQTRVSRWESGREEIPRKHRLGMRDIFLNTRGQISPLIEFMVRRDSRLAVMDGLAQTILKESPQVLKAYGLEKADVEGAEHAKVFDAQWKENTHLEYEFCALDYFRDIELAKVDGEARGFRCRVKMIGVCVEGYDRVVLRRTDFVGPSQGNIGPQGIEWLLPSSFES